MKRNPSVHLTYTDLVKVLMDIGIKDPEISARLIIQKGAPYAIKDRYIITGNSDLRKAATKAIENTQTAISIEKFNSILHGCRVAEQHRHITNITKGDIQYATLVEVAKMAAEFSTTCGFATVEDGCKVFVTLGLRFMKHGAQYGINKFKYYKNQIYSLYESSETIHEDPKEKETREVHDLWREYMGQYGGISRTLTKPEDYVMMVYTRMEADSVGAKYSDWLEAQFEFFKGMNLVPNPNQLIGDKALNRYYDFMGSSGKAKKKTVRTHAEAPDDFEKRYQKARKQLAEK
jgi:hypothetical protein